MAPVRRAILGVYRTFAEICERHGLRYWVGYGTLLGAVRHKGFIPWDDDFDLLMPRHDFNRLWPILEKELPAHLCMVTWRNAPAFCDIFGKVVETRADEVEHVESEAGVPLPEGIFIDVFPVDGAPSGMFGTAVARLRCWWRHAVYAMERALCRHRREFLRRRYMEACERHAQEIPFDGCSVCTRMVANRHALAWRCPADAFAETVSLPFEGLEVPAPAGYDVFLRVNYGDYMRLPPEAERRPIHTGAPVPWRLGGARK